ILRVQGTVMTKMMLSRLIKPTMTSVALCVAAAAAPLIGAAQAKPTAAVPFDGEIAQFYRARGGAPLWFARTSGTAADQFVQLLASAQADNLNPRRYDVRGLARAAAAARSGDPAAVQGAEAMFSAAFAAYARDLLHDPGVGAIYVEPELGPPLSSGVD